MELLEITAKSSPGRINDLIHLMADQMRAVGSERDESRVKRAIEHAMRAGSPAHFFVLYDEDEAVGTCLLNVGCGVESGGDYVWVNEVHVREDRRGRGLGRILLEYVKTWAAEHGCAGIYSYTSTDNERSKNLFGSAGFRAKPLVFLELSVKTGGS